MLSMECSNPLHSHLVSARVCVCVRASMCVCRMVLESTDAVVDSVGSAFPILTMDFWSVSSEGQTPTSRQQY